MVLENTLYTLAWMELDYWNGRIRIVLLGFMVGTKLRVLC